MLRLGDYKNYILSISDCWVSAMVQHFHILVSSIVQWLWIKILKSQFLLVYIFVAPLHLFLFHWDVLVKLSNLP